MLTIFSTLFKIILSILIFPLLVIATIISGGLLVFIIIKTGLMINEFILKPIVNRLKSK